LRRGFEPRVTAGGGAKVPVVQQLAKLLPAAHLPRGFERWIGCALMAEPYRPGLAASQAGGGETLARVE
jgi:hypothetical protein